MTTPSGKIIPPRQRKIALLGSRSVDEGVTTTTTRAAHEAAVIGGDGLDAEINAAYRVEGGRSEGVPARTIRSLPTTERDGMRGQALVEADAGHCRGWGKEGKSSLTVQFVDSHFVDSYYPTIENTFQKVVKYKGQDFNLDIIDTAGQDEFSILSSKHAVGLHGWVLVYSVSSRSSFEMIQIVREKVLNYTGRENVPMVLVGNKSDLAVQRQVPREEGAALAASWGMCGFTEASARHNENVSKIFELVVAQIEKDMNPEPEQAPKSGCQVM
ncbi:BQ5605_C019g08814 [Microbotryum silenes-dioicae]|uniref:BQ5605_C019g08814 protein n=1 Tax=Microbotryum silenes-dioicae TaxID=796604 RepID=A0A2X0M0G6_9BASI|nr:BQ5605_C019g08814 [Microbotryum silenes-dioicae]